MGQYTRHWKKEKKGKTQRLKIKECKKVVRPSLIHGGEAQTAKNKNKSSIAAVEIKFLLKIHGITMRDKIRNKKVRDQL